MFHIENTIYCNSDECTRMATAVGDTERARWLFEDQGWKFANWTLEDLTYCPDHASEA